MSWLNPWAWLGLTALAVPVAIHLLTRAEPRVLPFPTLRFLTTVTTTAIRRRAIRDHLLLAVRLGILAAVVAALAQPVFRTSAALSSTVLRRALVVDVSPSTRRPSTAGPAMVDLARREASTVTPVAHDTTTIDAARLAVGLARASAWLAEGGGREEVVVLSDFQRGALDASELDAVPATVGVRLIKIDGVAPSTVSGPASRVGERVLVPELTLDPDRTTVAWKPATTPAAPLSVLFSPAEATFVATASAAAGALGLPTASGALLTVVLPGAADRARLMRDSHPIDLPWMFTIVDRLRQDGALQAAASATHAALAPVPTATTVARDASGLPVVQAAASSGPSTLLLLAAIGHEAPADALLLGATLHGAARARVDRSALTELEPVTIPASELARWERPTPPTGTPPPARHDESQGRWLWLLALALLGLEAFIRRTGPNEAAAEVRHAA